MRKKRLNSFLITVLVACFVLGPMGIPIQAGYQVDISRGADSEGNLVPTCVLDVKVVGGTTLVFDSIGQDVVSSAQYLEVNVTDNHLGDQSILIYTDNKNASANPKYTGGGSGSGLVSTTDTTVTAPLHWVVFDSPQAGGYTFVPSDGDPIDTSIQPFVVDRSKIPFPTGYASVLSKIDEQIGDLAPAPASERTTTDGQIYIYVGANYTGAPNGNYQTSTLTVELVTVESSGGLTSLIKKSVTAQGNRS